MHSTKPRPRQQFLSVGPIILSKRTELQLSQEDLALMSGLHRTYISDVERGARNISLNTLCVLAKAIGLEPWEVLKMAQQLGATQ